METWCFLGSLFSLPHNKADVYVCASLMQHNYLVFSFYFSTWLEHVFYHLLFRLPLDYCVRLVAVVEWGDVILCIPWLSIFSITLWSMLAVALVDYLSSWSCIFGYIICIEYVLGSTYLLISCDVRNHNVNKIAMYNMCKCAYMNVKMYYKHQSTKWHKHHS